MTLFGKNILFSNLGLIRDIMNKAAKIIYLYLKIPNNAPVKIGASSYIL